VFMDWSEFQKNTIEEWILTTEGGYVNNPQDPGGETKYGISKRAYPNIDIAKLTLDQALNIYYNAYWQPLGLSNYPFPVAFVCLDCAILCGPRWISNVMKNAYLDLKSQVKNWDIYTMYILQKRISYHTADVNFKTFGQGWLNRVAKLMQEYIRLKPIFVKES
jgi:lysozyme family protein